MVDTVFAIVGVAIGVFLLLRRRSVAQDIVRTNNATWGLKWGQREKRMGELVLIPIGIAFVIYGVLTGIGFFR